MFVDIFSEIATEFLVISGVLALSFVFVVWIPLVFFSRYFVFIIL